jgi:hypothetical protein
MTDFILSVLQKPKVSYAPREEFAWSNLAKRLDGFLASVVNDGEVK